MHNAGLFRFLIYKKAGEKNVKLYLEIVDYWYHLIFEEELIQKLLTDMVK